LQAIGNEVGRKLEGIGKELGLPPVPTSLTLPPLPPLPLGEAAGQPREPAKKKELAAPVPSG
jgi:hypothetical protein